jgi:iron(II)-dependent oxidoreductase
VKATAALEDVRARTLAVLDCVPDSVLVGQHSPLMSPLVWDLGHVANYEDIWLVRGGVTGGSPLDDLYDAFRHPRKDRHALATPDPSAARAYGLEVRGRALAALDSTDEFIVRMVVQHEHQHDETMLAALQLLPGAGYQAFQPALLSRPGAQTPPGALSAHPDMTLLPGGPFIMGTSDDPVALDNERPAHPIDLPAFWLDTTPVTNAAYAEFVADGGYDDPRWWDESGWKWRQEAGLVAPQFWSEGSRTRFGFVEPIPAAEPVQHVCWYEADAFARWAGKRLPTESEWEFAASNGGTSRWPWGSADPTAKTAALWTIPSSFGPGPVGAHPDGVNQWGTHDLIGGVWEWTATDFSGHSGFVAYPYREYSEVFFGTEYKVLRGGSWGTDAAAVRATFRNWDFPIRRQIFAGFRCAKDA